MVGKVWSAQLRPSSHLDAVADSMNESYDVSHLLDSRTPMGYLTFRNLHSDRLRRSSLLDPSVVSVAMVGFAASTPRYHCRTASLSIDRKVLGRILRDYSMATSALLVAMVVGWMHLLESGTEPVSVDRLSVGHEHSVGLERSYSSSAVLDLDCDT